MKTQPTALEAAAKALARRDRSAADLTAYLERRGTAPEEAGEAVERLQQAGYVDDGRYAARRLAAKGFSANVIESALAALPGEEATEATSS